MGIIDFHAHIYPEKIAAKASRAIGEFYDAPIRYRGLTEELLESGSAAGVEYYVVHSTATKAAQVVSINDYIIGEIEKEPRFIGFGTIHPDFSKTSAGYSAADEIARILKAGIRGIKLHPDFQKFEADSPKMDGIYEELSALQVPVLIHAGDCRFDFSGPRRIAGILDKHPNIRLVAAHFGGYSEWDEVFEILAGRDLWFDTSSSFWKIPEATAAKIIKKHGTDRFLFGSDFPMWDHSLELKHFFGLGLAESDNRAILWDNAAALLNIKAK